MDFDGLSRRGALQVGIGGSLLVAGGCLRLGTSEDGGGAGEAEFSFQASGTALDVTFEGGATLTAGAVELRSTDGTAAAWNELGSTSAAADETLQEGDVATVGPDVINWEDPVESGETVRVVFVADDGSPTTLATYPTAETTQPTGTPTPQRPEFTRSVTDNWSGVVSLEPEDASLEIRNGGGYERGQNEPRDAPFGGAVRTEPVDGPPFTVRFEGVEFTRNSVENNLDLGLTAETEVRLFQRAHDEFVIVTNNEGVVDSTDDFVLQVGTGGESNHSAPFSIAGNGNDVRVTYGGATAEAHVDGERVASVSTELSGPLRGAVQLEDDPDTSASDTVRVGRYVEQA